MFHVLVPRPQDQLARRSKHSPAKALPREHLCERFHEVRYPVNHVARRRSLPRHYPPVVAGQQAIHLSSPRPGLTILRSPLRVSRLTVACRAPAENGRSQRLQMPISLRREAWRQGRRAPPGWPEGIPPTARPAPSRRRQPGKLSGRGPTPGTECSSGRP